MSELVHETVPAQVWADIDVEIAPVVVALNRIPGVRTHASCQGTLNNEGTNFRYRPYVMVSWESDELLWLLETEFDVDVEGDHWGYVHPRQ